MVDSLISGTPIIALLSDFDMIKSRGACHVSHVVHTTLAPPGLITEISLGPESESLECLRQHQVLVSELISLRMSISEVRS